MNRQHLFIYQGVLGLLAGCLLGGPAVGQELSFRVPTTLTEPLLPPPWDLVRWTGADGDRQAGDPLRSVRLFGMPSGYLSEPVGSDLDPDAPPPADAPPGRPGPDLPVAAAMWNDNPFFDVR